MRSDHVLIFPESKHLQIGAEYFLCLPYNPTTHKSHLRPPFSQFTEFKCIQEEKKNVVTALQIFQKVSSLVP